MPEHHPLQPAPSPSPEAVKSAAHILGFSDATLVKLVRSLSQGYIFLWGKPGAQRLKAEVEDILSAMSFTQAQMLFDYHNGIVQTLETKGMATFEAWEKVTPWVVTFDEVAETVTLGEELDEAWRMV